MSNRSTIKSRKYYKYSLVISLIVTTIFTILYILYGKFAPNLGSGQGALIIIIAPLYFIWIGTVIFTIACLVLTIKAHPIKRVQYFYASLGIFLVLSPIWISASIATIKSFWSSHSNPYHTAHTGGNDKIQVPCDQNKISLTGSEPYIEDSIAYAITCRVKQFYNENHTWPSEAMVYEMATNSYKDFVKNGYGIKINSKDGADNNNFVLHYDTNCAGNPQPGSLSVFTPFYLNDHRKCVYSA